MHPVSRKPEEHSQITARPNDVAEASLHESPRECRRLRQHGRMMPLPTRPSNQKFPPLPMKSRLLARTKTVSAMFCAVFFTSVGMLAAQDEPLGNDGHEREELGVNPYTTPSIARIFA